MGVKMKTILIGALLISSFFQVFSQELSTENISKIRNGLPPVQNLLGLVNLSDSNRIQYAELGNDTTKVFYFVIEHKLNNELFYWLVIPSVENQYNLISITPDRVNDKIISFEEDFSIENNLYSLRLSLITAEDKCLYTFFKLVPPKFPYEISCDIIFELLYSFYDHQITYPYYSKPQKGSELDGMCVSFSGKIKLSENYRFEVRPAIIWQSYLTGIDLGFHLRKKITDYLFIAPGIIFHYTAHLESGGHSGWATRDGWFAFPSITLCLPIIKSLPLLISYNFAHINNYYNYFRTFETQREQKNLNSIIRLGFQFGKWDF